MARPPDDHRRFRAIGIAAVVIGLAVVAAAHVAGIRPSASGIVLPVAAGFLAVFLGGLAVAATEPPVRRPPLLRHRNVVIGLLIWSTLGLAILAGGPAVWRTVFAPLLWFPRPIAEGMVVVVGTVAFAGVIVIVFGALYTLGFLGLAVLRRLVRRLRPAGGT